MPEPCIATWEAVEELGDNCPLCGRACYTHELHEDHRTMVEAFHARDAEVLLSASSLHYRRLQEVVETLPAIRLLP